jgi:hypothetical protein
MGNGVGFETEEAVVSPSLFADDESFGFLTHDFAGLPGQKYQKLPPISIAFVRLGFRPVFGLTSNHHSEIIKFPWIHTNYRQEVIALWISPREERSYSLPLSEN